jgi:hypothetical protein
MLDQPKLQSEFSFTWTEYCEDDEPVVTILRNTTCDAPPREGFPDKYPSHTLVLHIIILGQFAEERLTATGWLLQLVRKCTIEDLEELVQVPRVVLRDTGVIGNSSSQRYPLYMSALDVQRAINIRLMRLREDAQRGPKLDDELRNKAFDEAVEPTSCVVLMGNKESRKTRQRRRQREEREEAERYNAEAAQECTDLAEANKEQSADESGDDTQPDDELELERAEARAMRDRQLVARMQAEQEDNAVVADFIARELRRRGINPQSVMHGMHHKRSG